MLSVVVGVRLTVVVLCVGAVLSASACGGGEDGSGAEAGADHRLSLVPVAFMGSPALRRVGEWTRRGDIMSAWVVADDEGADDKADPTCVSVDIARRLDDESDVVFLVGTVPDKNCEGTKPMPQ